jgi:hypothetical protein
MAQIRDRAGLALLCGALALTAGCDLVTYRPPVGRDFGAPYVIRTGIPMVLPPGLVVATPAVDSQRRLLAVVEYEGGCQPHSFALASDAIDAESTTLWLVHDDGGDRCEELVRDTLSVDLGSAYRAGSMTLDTPSGEALALTSLAGGD